MRLTKIQLALTLTLISQFIIVMKKDDCLGCQTYFEHNERLALEDISIEHKNYSLPIKESKPKWILLKTITSFLNCKGGTIFIGVEDLFGAVEGVFLQRKERDQFKLFIKQLVERIHPRVDLKEKEQVHVQFVPVLRNKEFQGKYVVKIIVKQGDPAQTYCFSSKLKLENAGSGKTEQYEIFYAYYRHNMGGVDELTGLKLLQEVQRKASSPNMLANTFHEECNPQPPALELNVNKICFTSINKEEDRFKLEDLFTFQLEKLKKSTNHEFEHQMTYKQEKQSLVLEIEDKESFSTVKEYISKNLLFLNDSFSTITFREVGYQLNYYCFQNIAKKEEKFKKANKPEKNQKETQKPPQKNQIKEKQEKNSKGEKKEEKRDQIQRDKIHWSPPKMEQPPHFKKNKEQQQKPQQKRNSFSRKYSMILTHIFPGSRQQLLKFLLNTIGKRIQINHQLYVNSIQLFFKSQLDKAEYLNRIQKNQQRLVPFGFNQQIYLGQNQGKIKILNYDKNKKDEIMLYLYEKMQNDLTNVEFKKDHGKFYLECTLANKGAACKWLDQLLVDKGVKRFKIPGVQMGNKPKMKFLLNVDVNM